MAAYKRFEMKLMMDKPPNNAQNSMDFLLMPPPNMQMNTPFVLSGARMRRAPQQPNDTPSLLSRDSFDQNMDLEYDTANVKMSKTNASATNTNNDRVVFRTSGVNLTNGFSGAANGHSSVTKTSKVENDQLNAAKRDLFNLNGTNEAANAFSGSSNSIGISNGRENTSDASNGSLFGNGTNGIFGRQQNISNETAPKLNNDINGCLLNGFAGEKKNLSENLITHEKTSVKQSVFSRLSFDSNSTGRNKTMDVESSKKKYDAVFINGHTTDKDDNRFDDMAGIHSDGDEPKNTTANNGQNQSNGNLKTKQQTNAADLFETAPFPMNAVRATINGGDNAANQKFGDFNQQPSGKPNSSKIFTLFSCISELNSKSFQPNFNENWCNTANTTAAANGCVFIATKPTQKISTILYLKRSMEFTIIGI